MATNDLTTAPMEIQNIMPNLKNTGDQNMDLSSLELFNTDFMSSIQPDLQLQLNQIFATSSQPVPTNPLQPSVDFNTVKPPLLLPSHAPVQQLGRAQIPLPFPGEINSAANFPQQISLLQQQNMIPPQLMLNQMNQTFHSQMAGPDMINGFSPPNQSKSKRFTDTQVSQLLEAFNAKPNQSKEERAELAKQIGLTEEQVTNWFQRKKTNDKKTTSNASTNPPITNMSLQTPTVITNHPNFPNVPNMHPTFMPFPQPGMPGMLPAGQTGMLPPNMVPVGQPGMEMNPMFLNQMSMNPMQFNSPDQRPPPNMMMPNGLPPNMVPPPNFGPMMMPPRPIMTTLNPGTTAAPPNFQHGPMPPNFFPSPFVMINGQMIPAGYIIPRPFHTQVLVPTAPIQPKSPIEISIEKLLGNSKALHGHNKAKAFPEIMKEAGDDVTSRILTAKILEKTIDEELFWTFLRNGGIELMNSWVSDCTTEAVDKNSEDNATLLQILLIVLKKMPMDIETLKNTELGKNISTLRKKEVSVSKEIKQLSLQIREKWKKMVEEEGEKDKKKRKIDEDEVVDAKKTKLGEDKKNSVLGILNIGGPLPSFKKAEKPVESTSTAMEVDVKEDDGRKNSAEWDVVVPVKPTVVERAHVARRHGYRKERTDEVEAREKIDSDQEMESTSEAVDKSPVLAEQKPIKKRVSWAPENDLVKIKFFESDESEQKHEHGSAREDERHEGSMWKEQKVVKASITFYSPQRFQVDASQRRAITVNSEEARIQEERERGVLESTYYADEQIPDTPSEPPTDITQPSVYKPMPLDALMDSSAPPEPVTAPAPAPVVVPAALQLSQLQGLGALLGNLGRAQPNPATQNILQMLQNLNIPANNSALMPSQQSQQQYTPPNQRDDPLYIPSDPMYLSSSRGRGSGGGANRGPPRRNPNDIPVGSSRGGSGGGSNFGSAGRGRGRGRAPPRESWTRNRPCKFFGEGFCAKGDNCEFSHDRGDF